MYRLEHDVEYEIEAEEQESNYGTNYVVKNINRNKPTSEEDTFFFLREILSENQARTLVDAYPNIVEKVMNDDLSDIDLNKLYGIKEKTFEKIKVKIIENFKLADIVSEFQGKFTLSVIKKLYDKYSSVELIRRKLERDPYKCLCGISGIGFKTADNILLDIEDENKKLLHDNKEPIIQFADENLRESQSRCRSCIQYLLKENEKSGHTSMSLTSLREQCMKLVPGCSKYFTDCLKEKEFTYDVDRMIVSLTDTYETECYIAMTISKALKLNNKWNYDVEKYRNAMEFPLTDEQMKAVENVCNNTISILNGGAGTGKSSSTLALIQLLKDNHLSFTMMAPTGKAAKVLSEYTKCTANTIHRALGYMPPNKWLYNETNRLPHDVVLIDEFSMTDIFLFERVLRAIDFNKTKLVIIGDNCQLPSVGCGNLLHDFMSCNYIPTQTLTKIFRYGEGGLMKVATDVRFCKPYLKGITNKVTPYGENSDYYFVSALTETIVSDMVNIYKCVLGQGYLPSDIKVLSAYRKGDIGSIVLNNKIQRVANPNFGSKNFMKCGETVFYEGDLVLQNINNYKAKLALNDFSDEDFEKETFIANGETGVILEVNKDNMIIDFDGVVVEYTQSDLLSLELGYCMTIHKSQGDNARVIILLTPRSHTFMLNSNLIYVGLTRMKEKCYHLGNIKTVNTAVKKKANLQRNTNMQYLFKKYMEE